MATPADPPSAKPDDRPALKQRLAVFRFALRAFALVWTTSRPLTVGLALGTLTAGLLPGAIALVGKELVDAIVLATRGAPHDAVVDWLVVEAALVVALATVQRVLGILRSLLRAQLGHRVNVLILDKALQLELAHFEDADFYDRVTRARREASQRPLSLVTRTFEAIQSGITVTSYAVLLAAFSPLALLVLVAAGLPAFFAEAKFAGDAFRLFKWRTPEVREQGYLETVVAREDHVKEVKLFGLGRRFLDRYIAIFHLLYAADRKLTMRRGLWGLGLGILSTAAFYGAYVWIALETAHGHMSLGAMTMYVMVFRQGQSSLSSLLSNVSGLYEDHLYLSSLYELLDEPITHMSGTATEGPSPGDGLRFEDVSFTYPGSQTPALDHVTFHVPAGSKLAIVGENGSGKTTLVKLLARLYDPTGGRVLFEGLDLRQWNPEALRRRIGIIFQDFVRYQMTVGQNIGAGDEPAYDDRDRWKEAADKGLATPVVEALPKGFDTQLGRWFKDGRELSLGQWQKVALSRAFMRKDADILVLDEPTASMDAEAEVKVFERFRELTEDQIAIVISHRFSTVRMADTIIVLDQGRVVEAGSHAELVARGGRYATLFSLQAAGYR
ncbi:MAG: ABC transporter ATP-binding protein [Deltaproteobacteria bacterium]|nr:ABC transporter ATP-binding protein [Deltaproteobacteria bacterium]